jgi:hypothetical protein
VHRLCFAVSVAGLVTIASALAQAQEPDTLTAPQRTGFALERLGGGQWVRIRASGVGLVEGSVVSDSPNLVRLRTADGSTLEVPAPGVDSLWVRGGSHAGTGALIGGAVVGIGFGVLAQGFSGIEGGCNDAWSVSHGATCGAGPFFLGFLVGGASGALVGALIGAPFPRWQQRTGFALARLQVGQQVRIRTGGDRFVQGWISNSPNLVTLRTADGSRIEVPTPGIDSLWVRGTHASTGALIGGAVAGIGLGAFLAYHMDHNPYTARNTVAGGLGLVGGGVGGAAIGANIGSDFPRWQLRVP